MRITILWIRLWIRLLEISVIHLFLNICNLFKITVTHLNIQAVYLKVSVILNFVILKIHLSILDRLDLLVDRSKTFEDILTEQLLSLICKDLHVCVILIYSR